jgi:RNA polymerase sigma factor (sigma-70 family)
METHPPEIRTREAIAERLIDLWELTGDERLHLLALGRRPVAVENATALSDQEYFDWISTTLMDLFKTGSERAVFALLFELNRPMFLLAITSKLRRSSAQVDPQDVLQEVFLNIYRYPHRFVAERADSFRSWGHRIVRNTLLKLLKGATRDRRFGSIDDDESPVQWQDPRVRTPLGNVEAAESAAAVNWAFLLYLNLYLAQFERLCERERRALTMVEVDGATYKHAADALGLRLENLKMVIFRGRRKIYRGLALALEDLGAPPAVTDATLAASAARRPSAPAASIRPLPPPAAAPAALPATRRNAAHPANDPFPSMLATDVVTDA